MAIEAWLCFSCVMEKCHKLSIVPNEIGYRDWKSHCSISVCLNLLCCMPAHRNTALTSDKQHLHQGPNFLP